MIYKYYINLLLDLRTNISTYQY